MKIIINRKSENRIRNETDTNTHMPVCDKGKKCIHNSFLKHKLIDGLVESTPHIFGVLKK